MLGFTSIILYTHKAYLNSWVKLSLFYNTCSISMSTFNYFYYSLSKLKDEDLFVINEGKSENIKANRKMLADDRFKQYNEERSKYERDKIKKLMKNPDLTKKKPKKQKEEVVDLWDTPEDQLGIKITKNYRRDKAILDKKHDKIKRVVLPLAGQSYNPPAVEHKSVMNKVVEEVKDQVDQEKKLELELNPELRPEAQDLDERIAKLKEKCLEMTLRKGLEPVGKIESDHESDEDDDKPTRLSVNPPVDREHSLTVRGRKMRNQQLRIKRQHIIEKRARQRAHKNRPPSKKKLRENKRLKELQKKNDEEERQKWESEGVVSKPKKLGLYKYKKQKTEFVVEDNLPDSLRKQKGSESLVLDQFDSFYRRNMLPVEAPPGDLKKTKVRQYKEHQTNTEKWMRLEAKRKGDRAKEMAREKLRERKRRAAIAKGQKLEKENKDEEELIFL